MLEPGGESGIGNRAMGQRICESIVGYYLALRVSASVATSVLETRLPEVEPTVRSVRWETLDGFDPREIIPLGRGYGVVTVPAERFIPGSKLTIGPN
jgi:hypothetical protein